MQLGKMISAMFLVGGTCIGGGMLALPLATGISGFLPSITVMAFCWLAMTSTALLLIEASLWMQDEVHIISMTSRILGLPGKAVAWILYLFICYASIVAYTAGGGIQLASLFNLSRESGCAIFIALFGGVIYLGNTIVGRVNAILFSAMIAAYFLLVGMGVDEVKPDLLAYRRWSSSLLALPLLLTAFSFQTMVPSLTPYLKRNVNALRIATVGGTLIAFLVYAVWEALILGIVPVEGANGLTQALARGEPATQFLYEHVEGVWIAQIADFFAFFALVTSFLGMSLGLFDFLADGFHIKKAGWGKVLIGAMIILPTFIFAVKFERIFLLALDATGGYGDTILNGLIPVAMVWVGRYKMGYREGMLLPGGRVTLAIVGSFFLYALVMEVLSHMGHVQSIYDSYELLEAE